MPLDDSEIDPQYGAPRPPPFADFGPTPGDDPWGWVPPDWRYGDGTGAAPPLDASVDQTAGPPPTPPSEVVPVDAGAPPPQPLVQPNLMGIPASAVDAAVPSAPVLGPPTEGAAAAPPPEAQPAAPGAAPPVPPPYGFTPPPAAGPAAPPFGPQPATSVSQLANVSTEQAPTQAGEILANPLAMEDNGPLAPSPKYSDEEANDALIQLGKTHPELVDEIAVKRDAIKQNFIATRQLEESTKNRELAQANHDAWIKASAKTNADMAALNATADRIANTKVDPNGGMNFAQKLAGLVAVVVGGLYQGKTGGARNPGLDALNDSIKQRVEEQKNDLARQMQGVNMQRSALGEQYARNDTELHAADALRIGSYQQGIDAINAEAQKFDPRSTTAIRLGHVAAQWQQARDQATHAAAQERQKTNFELIKADQEQQKIIETRRKDEADEAERLLKLAGKGGEGLARVPGQDPKYTVDTGLTNPFDPTQPLYGVRQLGGHGEDPKERATVENAINSYAHAQDGWARLREIGERIQFHKSQGENVWSRFKDTDAAAYDAATHSLVVDLTKELGDKLTQGQIDEQGKRIPQRTGWLETRDVAKLIKDSQEEADQHLSRDLTLYGVDPKPVIRSSQQVRATVRPSPQQRIDAAQAAVATNPGDRNAQQELSDAQQDLSAQVGAEQKRTRSIEALRSAPALPAAIPEDKSRSADEIAAARAANIALKKAALLQQKYETESAARPPNQKLLPGDRAVAEHDRLTKLGDLARETVDARDLAIQQRDKAQALARENDLRQLSLDVYGVNDPGLGLVVERDRRMQGLDPATGEPPKAAPTPTPAPVPAPAPAQTPAPKPTPKKGKH